MRQSTFTETQIVSILKGVRRPKFVRVTKGLGVILRDAIGHRHLIYPRAIPVQTTPLRKVEKLCTMNDFVNPPLLR